jgi:hypothetical protein
VVIAAILAGLFGLLALWTVISPQSVYWALTAWQYKDPDANEPSETAYGLSRVAGLVTLAVLAVFGFQAAGWQAESQAREDCRTVLLPALRGVVRSKPVTSAALGDFARVHDLTIQVSTIHIPTYPTPRRTVSPSPTASTTGTPTRKPSAQPTPRPTPTTSRTTTSRPTSPGATIAITTYSFQRNGTLVIAWTDSANTLAPNPSCKV